MIKGRIRVEAVNLQRHALGFLGGRHLPGQGGLVPARKILLQRQLGDGSGAGVAQHALQHDATLEIVGRQLVAEHAQVGDANLRGVRVGLHGVQQLALWQGAAVAIQRPCVRAGRLRLRIHPGAACLHRVHIWLVQQLVQIEVVQPASAEPRVPLRNLGKVTLRGRHGGTGHVRVVCRVAQHVRDQVHGGGHGRGLAARIQHQRNGLAIGVQDHVAAGIQLVVGEVVALTEDLEAEVAETNRLVPRVRHLHHQHGRADLVHLVALGVDRRRTGARPGVLVDHRAIRSDLAVHDRHELGQVVAWICRAILQLHDRWIDHAGHVGRGRGVHPSKEALGEERVLLDAREHHVCGLFARVAPGRRRIRGIWNGCPRLAWIDGAQRLRRGQFLLATVAGRAIGVVETVPVALGRSEPGPRGVSVREDVGQDGLPHGTKPEIPARECGIAAQLADQRRTRPPRGQIGRHARGHCLGAPRAAPGIQRGVRGDGGLRCRACDRGIGRLGDTRIQAGAQLIDEAIGVAGVGHGCWPVVGAALERPKRLDGWLAHFGADVDIAPVELVALQRVRSKRRTQSLASVLGELDHGAPLLRDGVRVAHLREAGFVVRTRRDQQRSSQVQLAVHVFEQRNPALPVARIHGGVRGAETGEDVVREDVAVRGRRGAPEVVHPPLQFLTVNAAVIVLVARTGRVGMQSKPQRGVLELLSLIGPAHQIRATRPQPRRHQLVALAGHHRELVTQIAHQLPVRQLRAARTALAA